MTPFLTGRVALVTGASRGLGAGTARMFARAGAAVIATGRDAEALDSLVQQITREGAQAIALPADLTSDAEIKALVAQSLEAAQRIDFLLHVGGSATGIGEKLWQVSAESWESVCQANITGTLNLIRHVTPVMQRQHAGRMLFLSSSATFRPWAETGAYAATKAAVNQMVQTLAIELEGSGVTVNAFNPGPIDTPVYERVAQVLARTGQNGAGQNAQAAGRPPEVAAQLLLWLCAPEMQELTGEFVQWTNPNTRAAIQDFLQTHRIGAVA